MGETITVGGGAPSGNRRVLVLAGVAAAVLLAVVVLPGLLFGGDSGSPVDDFPPPTSVVPANGVPGDAADQPPETFEPFSSKNPFLPLVATGPAGGGNGSVVVDDPPPVVGDDDLFPPFDDGDFPPFDDPADPGDPGDPGDPAGPGDPAPPTTAPPRQPDRVSLLEVYTDPGGRLVASVRVNDDTHQVVRGQDFAGSYRVLDLDIDTRCGQFLFGDDRFSLCEGDEVLK